VVPELSELGKLGATDVRVICGGIFPRGRPALLRPEVTGLRPSHEAPEMARKIWDLLGLRGRTVTASATSWREAVQAGIGCALAKANHA